MGRYNKSNRKKRLYKKNDKKGSDGSYKVSHEDRQKLRLAEGLKNQATYDEFDKNYGFQRHKRTGVMRLGYIFNAAPCTVKHPEKDVEMAGLDIYCIEKSGGHTFKATMWYEPYFYIWCDPKHHGGMEEYLNRKFEGLISQITKVQKKDLDQKNHLTGLKRTYLKLIFHNTGDLRSVSKYLQVVVEKNQAKQEAEEAYGTYRVEDDEKGPSGSRRANDMLNHILQIREYDVRYITRVFIDTEIRVGKWHEFWAIEHSCCRVVPCDDEKRRARDYGAMIPPDMTILAYDIETTKAPLKFPDNNTDQVMMISYQTNDAQGFLIVNREIVSEDIEDFDYTPSLEYPGTYHVFNERDEKALLQRFFAHMREIRPNVYVTYNGDFFDWPFVEARAAYRGLNMDDEIGVWSTQRGAVYTGRVAPHLDCFKWVERDSYLPQGSQNLKAVVRKKLGYDPVELDPEDMTPYARNRPQELAAYSVSDAVATYYLYTKYIESFIFSLANIIPMVPDDVLRKGSGTLCESLLMVMAYRAGIIAPNKQNDYSNHFYKGHLLDSTTYIGGHVDCFHAGIFRSDLETEFAVEPDAYQELIDNVDEVIRFGFEEEAKVKVEDVKPESIEKIKADIIAKLESIRDKPRCSMKPIICHLDVASMYPNIILTNRLQPMAIVNDDICAACDFNRPGATCQRSLNWKWRGRYYPASKGEFNQLQAQIQTDPIKLTDLSNNYEIAPWQDPDEDLEFADLPPEEQNRLLKKRVKDYSIKMYKRQADTVEEYKEDVVCQRENGFYVDTVLLFRDRRYMYKGLRKKHKKAAAKVSGSKKIHHNKMAVMYDSMQLAHKCILNSFYGYVMRRGARWYSMPMAAITTHVGANIIKDAFELCRRIGKPLELDTDGIWTMLPGTFPLKYKVEKKDGGDFHFEYANSMLNIMTDENFNNPQYHQLTDDKSRTYEVQRKCSIEFEFDGPYLAMILPASTDEGKMLKKRYAVYNFDHSLEELKGFEIKRRGELQIIKRFQEEIFPAFLVGTTIQECYTHVGKIARRYLDILDTKAVDIPDHELLDLIVERKNMSKSLEEYGNQKGTALTCAKRLAAFLGPSILEGGKLATHFIISRRPVGAPVSSRAIPVQIFKTERAVMKTYLRKWTSDGQMQDFGIRSILDWEYYRKRLGSTIQKIVSIPSAMQKVRENPVPGLAHPTWLEKKLRELHDPFRQRKLTGFFKKAKPKALPPPTGMDIEDMMGGEASLKTVEEDAPMEDQPMGLFEMARDDEPTRTQSQTQSSQPTPSKQSLTDKIKASMDALRVDEDKLYNPALPALADRASFKKWSKASKAHWRALRARRKKLPKRRGGSTPNSRARKKRRLGTFGAILEKKMRALYNNTWQIIQVAPGNRAGSYVLWVFTDRNSMHQVRVNVNRVLYVNTNCEKRKGQLENRSGKSTNRVLPRGRPLLHLLQMEMAEETFREGHKDYTHFLNEPDVEGVYEMRVPLDFRLISKIGCCTKVDRFSGEKDSHYNHGFDLKELDWVPCAMSPYLEDVRFKHIFIHVTQCDKRALIALYIMNPRKSNEYDVHFIHVREPRTNVEQPNHDDQVKAALENWAQENQTTAAGLESLMSIRFKWKPAERCKTMRDAYKAASKHLDDYRTLHSNKPTIVLIQSQIKRDDFVRNVHVIKGNFPTVELNSAAIDSEYPALQWYSHATQYSVLRFFQMPEKWNEACSFARYVHVPVGNIPTRSAEYASDMFYGRLCHDSKMLWWISDGKLPDLGGREEDENLFEDEHKNLEIVHSGAYHTICMELNMNNLCVNAIYNSDKINRIESMGMNVPEQGEYGKKKMEFVKTSASTSYDETSVKEQFLILKKLVSNWLKNCSSGDPITSAFADAILHRLYRWLREPSSMFYDPLLFRMVYKMMQKIFLQLLARFKRLGCKLIYANFHKIIIETGKTTVADAVAYTMHIAQTICEKSKDGMFQYINLEPGNMWANLYFVDIANHGGFCIEATGHEGMDDEDAVNSYRKLLRLEFNLAKFLPQIGQDYFTVVMGMLFQTNSELCEQIMTAHNKAVGSQSLGSTNPWDEYLARRKTWIIKTLGAKLYKIIPEIREKHPGNRLIKPGEQASAFPVLPGSHLPLTDPALEFVKYVIRILQLDDGLHEETMVLRTNCLKICEVRGFDPESLFKDPCLTYVLPDVICDWCQAVSDLDICRDPNLTEDSRWACQKCGEPYRRETVEAQLIEVVRRRETSYQIQDLKERSLIKDDQMSLYGPSGALWKCQRVGPEEYRQNMNTFLNIARHHNFELLEEICNWVSNDMGRTELPQPGDQMVG